MSSAKKASLLHPNRIVVKGLFFVFTTLTVLILIVYLFFQYWFSTEKIKQFIDHLASDNNIEIVYDLESSSSWLINPTLKLTNVRLREKQVNSIPFLLAKEIKIQLNYAFLWGELAIADLNINHADFLFHKKEHENWRLFSSSSLENSPIYQQLPVKKLTIKAADLFFYDQMRNQGCLFKQSDISWNKQLNYPLQLSSEFYHGNHYFGTIKLSSKALRLDEGNIYLDNAKIDYQMDFNYLGRSHFDIALEQLSFNQQGINGLQTNIDGRSPVGTFSAELDNWYYSAEDLALFQVRGSFLAEPEIEQQWSGDYQFATVNLKPDLLKTTQANISLSNEINQHRFIFNVQGDLNYALTENVFNADNIIITGEQIDQLNLQRVFLAKLKGKVTSNLKKNINFSLKGDINQHDLSIDGNYNSQSKTWLANLNLETLDLNLLTNISSDFPDIVDILIAKTNFILDNLGDKTYKTKVNIDKIKSNSFKLSQFSMNILAQQKQLSFNDIIASIYGGQSIGQLIIYKKDQLYAEAEHNLKGIKIDPWLYNWFGINNLVGVGDSTIQLSAHGKELQDFKQSLSGSTIFRLANGSINGVDIPYLLNNIDEISSLENFKQQFPFERDKKTPFKVFSAQTIWQNGIGNTLATAMYGQNFYLSGQGEINLPENKLDYLLSIYYDVLVAGRSKEIVLPIRINGELDHPVYSLDYQSIIQGSHSEKEKQQALREFIYKRWGTLP